jgi:hypothetical protein
MTRTRILVVLIGVMTLVQAASVLGASPALKLLIDTDTNEAWIENVSATAVTVYGYEIRSIGGNLDPAGWESIADAEVTRPGDVTSQLGAAALSFHEGGANSGLYLGEASFIGEAVFQPGAPWSIGQPVLEASIADLAFTYLGPADVNPQSGGIELVPEPATLSLLSLGGLAVLRRRKRRARQ